MRKIAVLSLVCVSVLLAQSSDEIYKRAQAFETRGDYKSAMMEYKKLATKAVATQKAPSQTKPTSLSEPSYSSSQASTAKIDYTPDKEYSQKPLATYEGKKSLYPRADEEDSQWLYMYKPTYIGWAYDFDDKDGMYGEERKNDEIKFQLSFQKPLFDDFLGLDETWAFAYTQTSFWQARADSAPFRDTDYEPELFVTVPTDGFLDYVRLGVSHESNGKAGIESRSWNRAYLSTSFNFGNLRITPRVWHSFTFDKDNDDIRQYMGYGDIEFTYDIKDHHITALWRNNLRFDSDNRGALELNYYFPLFNTGVHGFLQYFTGYGESLYDYNQHVDKVMLGIAFYED